MMDDLQSIIPKLADYHVRVNAKIREMGETIARLENEKSSLLSALHDSLDSIEESERRISNVKVKLASAIAA